MCFIKDAYIIQPTQVKYLEISAMEKVKKNADIDV